MKKPYVVLCVNAVFLVIIMLFVKYEMDQNRKQLTADLAQAMHDSPGKIARDTLGDLGLAVTNNPATNGVAPPPANDPLGSVLDVAANTVQRAEKAVSSETVAGAVGRVDQLISTNGSGQPVTNDAVGSLLKLAADAGQRVDQIALRVTAITDEEEIEFGRQLDEAILKDVPAETNSANVTRLENLARGVLPQCQRTQIKYHFRVLTSKTVTAFSIAGGYVYVSSSYLKQFPSDGELAMTLGHEIAHVELKHAVQRVQYEYHGEKLFGGLVSVPQAGYAVLSSPYTKEQEFDADAWGFAACKKAGWDSDRLLALFVNLEKYEQQQAASSPPPPPTEFERRMGEYFDSHPSTADRLARLKGM